MNSVSHPLKALNQIASEQLRFNSLYRHPRHCRSFIGSSPRPVPTTPRSPTPSTSSSNTVTWSSPRCEHTLEQIAHLATCNRTFVIYPELRLAPANFGPSPHGFLSPRPLACNSISLSELEELNRLAKIVEISSPHSRQPPIYGEPPRLSESLSHDKRTQMIVSSLLHFTSKSFALNDFHTAFPSTAKPKVSYFSGQPRVDKDKFNELLVSKLGQLRSVLGINFTPKGAPALLSSWINKLLCGKPPTARKVVKSHVSEQKTKKNREITFTAPQTAKVADQDSQYKVLPDVISPDDELKQFELHKVLAHVSTNPLARQFTYKFLPTVETLSHNSLCGKDISDALRIFNNYDLLPSVLNHQGPLFDSQTLTPLFDTSSIVGHDVNSAFSVLANIWCRTSMPPDLLGIIAGYSSETRFSFNDPNLASYSITELHTVGLSFIQKLLRFSSPIFS